MKTAAQLAPGSVLAGFRIEAQIGRGGMGVVYRATQLSLERPVALKLISPELAAEERFRERFLREARLAASLDHPHVLPVYEAGEEAGTLFLAMRLVEGASLAELLRREGRLASERALRLCSQLAQALEAAHEAGLLHRDVKPGNVLLSGAGDSEHAYLCDFGLARRLAAIGLTQERAFLGTARYAAPEQIRGEPLDERSDLYALACLFYECLCGEPPFAAEDELALLWAQLHEPPPAPGSLDPVLSCFDSFFARALAKDPDERFASATELAAAARAAPAASEARPAAPRPALRLPRLLTSFLGRERELAEVLELLLSEDVRLLTLSGPGGTGKTRLALRAAEEAAPAFADGVYWVALASLRDPGLVGPTIAQVLGAKGELAGAIGERRLLLVLDNLEQVIAAAPELAALVAECPYLRLLVTSRELLRLQGELEYPVPPLAEPEAVALFTARARPLKPRFEPDEHVEEICRRLDGLPLALELAAARVKILTPAQIAERLDRSLELLTAGSRDTPERQQTLRATIEWSYDLLDEKEKELFASLAVFVGSFDLEAAENVYEADLDTLASLVDKSLLRQTEEGRFFMLETIREYAADRLAETGKKGASTRRHAEYYVAVAEGAPGAGEGTFKRDVVDHLYADLDNFRAALDYFAEAGPHELELRLVTAMTEVLQVRGHAREARRRMEGALTRAADAPAGVRARALANASDIARLTGDVARSVEVALESLALAQELDDRRAIARALHELGESVAADGDYDRAAELYRQAVDAASEAGVSALTSTANLLDLALSRGDFEDVIRGSTDLLEQSRAEGSDIGFMVGSFNLASALVQLGRSEQARAPLSEALESAASLGYWEVVSWCLLATAALLETDDRSTDAVAIFRASESARAERGLALGPSEQRLREYVLSLLCDPQAHEGGTALPLVDAVTLARKYLD